MYLCVYVHQIFLLSDQNGALVRHMSFQGKKIICSPALWNVLPVSLQMITCIILKLFFKINFKYFLHLYI